MLFLNDVKLLNVIFFSLVVLLLVLSIYALHDRKFFLFQEDETIYYGSAKLFYETSSIKIASCINEDASKILQTSWYGPFYHIFFGGIAKIFGFNNYYFIIVNLLLIILSGLILSVLNISVANRIFLLVAFLSSPGILSYIFTYYPESLHIFFSVILVFVLVKIYQLPELRKYKSIFVVLVLFFTLFRITTIFWLIGIIPFSKNKNSLILYLFVFVSGVILALLYMKFFTAPAFASGLKSFNYLFSLHLIDFIKSTAINFSRNIYYVFLQSSVALYFLFVLFLLTIAHLFEKWNKILISAILIASISFLTLLAFYTSDAFFLEKQTAFLFPLLIVVNLITLKQINKILIVIFICALPFSLAQTFKNIQNRRFMNLELAKRKQMTNQFSELSYLVNPNKENIILWLYSEYDFPNRATESIIPFSNRNAYPIRYTTNICSSTAPDSIKYKRFGKMDIDYILSRNTVDLNDVELIKKTDYFYFYRIIKNIRGNKY